jgi:hypothetical protein
MELAEGQTVRYLRLALWVTVGHDVGGFEEFLMP